jgi:glucose/arabinose dehydrogenase
MNKFILLILLVCSLITVPGQEIQNPPIPNFHTPEESMKRIKLQDGFKLELVASEPDINEPVIIEWDANGRLYVVEMNTYMQDIDGKNQRDATSRVIRFEDTNGDGNMDKHTVFIDSLVLPRMLLTTTKDKVVVRETDTFDLYSYEDTDGDGKSDKKELVYKGGRRGGNRNISLAGCVGILIIGCTLPIRIVDIDYGQME